MRRQTVKKSRLEYRLQAGRTPLIRLPLPVAQRILIRVNAVRGPQTRKIALGSPLRMGAPHRRGHAPVLLPLDDPPPTSGVVYLGGASAKPAPAKAGEGHPKRGILRLGTQAISWRWSQDLRNVVVDIISRLSPIAQFPRSAVSGRMGIRAMRRKPP